MSQPPPAPRRGVRGSAFAARAFAMIEGGGLGRFLAAMGPTGFALGLQFLAFAITARGLGVEAFGQYAAITALAAIAVEFVGFGGADLLVRAVARDAGRFPGYFGNMLLLIAMTLVPVALVALWIAIFSVQSTITVGLLALALLTEIMVGRVSSSVELAMVAHGHVFAASCVRVATAGTRLIAAALYFLLASGLDGWIWVVATQATLLSLALLIVATRRYGRPAFRLQSGEFNTGFAFAVNQSARALQGNVDRVVLSRFAGDAALGTYAAGTRVMAIGVFPIQVMTRILYPEFFRRGAGGLAAARRYAVSKVPVMLATGLMSAGAVAAVAQLLPFALGRDFAESRWVAMWLALSLPLMCLQYLAADALTGAGFQHVRAMIYAAASIGFAAVVATGARLGGVPGLIAAYLGAHALFAIILWATAFLMRDGGEVERADLDEPA
ncbi:lipopolysaccharide biosynthesis protein [Sphingomonas sp. 1P06PA]|uniref:lipopolysaccharide biosynthesis protein n=1 Tax=Sphingomonas sp. 1P06PA TaxID=554121 RepID=UPI0039A57425